MEEEKQGPQARTTETTIEERWRMIGYWECCSNQIQTATNFQVSQSAISKIINKWKLTGNLEDFPRSGRPSVQSSHIEDSITDMVYQNKYVSAQEIELELDLARSTTFLIFKNMGLKYSVPNQIPQLNESHIAKRLEYAEENKNTYTLRVRGRNAYQQWILGICERGRSFERVALFCISNRSSQILVPIIKNYVSDDCKFIFTDKWKGYSTLNKEGYRDFTVNHKRNFVERKRYTTKRKQASQRTSKKGQYTKDNKNLYKTVDNEFIHTQTIESVWSHLKRVLRKKTGPRNNFFGEICQAYFQLSCRKNLQENALKIIQ